MEGADGAVSKDVPRSEGAAVTGDIGFLLDKKRKLETSFKIPKKKRTEEVLPEAPAAPVKEEVIAVKKEETDRNKHPNNKHKKPRPQALDIEKESTVEVKTKSKPLLQTPKPLLDLPDPLPAGGEDVDEDDETPTETKTFTLEEPKPEISNEYVSLEDGTKHIITKEVWLKIFTYLQPGNLSQCMRVCKVWKEWLADPLYWKLINLSRFGPIFPDMLKSIVLRQPVELDLSYSTISRKQTDWLLPRLPGLRTVRLSGLSTNIIGSLYGNMVPNLYHIDVRWVDELNDWTLRDLLCVMSPGKESKPRFADLKGLQLAGCPISEDAIKNIVQYCPNLEFLDMSYNTGINDRVIDNLCNSPLIYTIKSVDFSGCPNVTDKSLLQLKKCFSLEWLDFRSCKDVTRGACLRYTHSSNKDLTVTEDKLIHPPLVSVYS